MAFLFWDASGLAKRFAIEVGSEVANSLLSDKGRHTMATTVWGYLETFSILVRRRNAKLLGPREFIESASALDAEIIESGRFRLLTLTEEHALSAIAMIGRHNLNATDGAILAMLLDDADSGRARDGIVLVASDKRFLRAAEAEGFATIDPEAHTPESALALLASL